MSQQASSMIDIGTDAMLELEEMIQGLRRDAPSLKEFFSLLRTPTNSPVFAGNSAMSMLADVRAYPVLRDATGIKLTKSHIEYEKVLLKYLDEIEQGVDKENKSFIKKGKTFCSSLLGNMISKDMTEIFQKKGDLNNSSHMANALI